MRVRKLLASVIRLEITNILRSSKRAWSAIMYMFGVGFISLRYDMAFMYTYTRTLLSRHAHQVDNIDVLADILHDLHFR